MADARSLGLVLAITMFASGTVASSEPLRGVVIVGESAAAALRDQATAPAVAATRLPTRPRGYTEIEVLVIGRDALARLDERRLRTLLEYAGSCGRILLVDTPGDAEYVLSRRTGCGARFVMATDASGAAASLARMLASRPRPMIDAASLRALLPEANGEVRLMTLFLSGFLGVFLVLLALPVLRPAALGFCLLATVVAGMLWTGGHNDAFVAWAEVSGDDRIARYASLGAATATGRGSRQLPLADFGRHPLRIIGPGHTLEEDAGQIRWSAMLMASITVEAAGSFPVEPALRADIVDGTPRVCNRGQQDTGPAWLAVEDRVYKVPKLAPGESWQPAGQQARAGALTRLLRQRADGLAVLHTLSVPGDRAARQAWLMRREMPSKAVMTCAH